jgi:hypothetical protein
VAALVCALAIAAYALMGGVAPVSSCRNYDLPPGDAAITLRQVSAISGREVLFAAEVVRGVRTNAVRGNFTPLEAVTRLLAGTVLCVVQHEKTGALAVRRAAPATNAKRSHAP